MFKYASWHNNGMKKQKQNTFENQVRKMLRMGYRPEEMLAHNLAVIADDIKKGKMDYEEGKAEYIHFNHIILDIAREEGVEVKRVGAFI